MFVKSAPAEIFDDMLAAWHALPRTEGIDLPLKRSFNPAALRKHLHNIGMTEHVGGGQMVIRLAGSNSCEFWGRELKGETYGSLAANMPEQARVPLAVVEAFMNTPCGIKSFRELIDDEGHVLRGDVLCLPLAAKSGEPKFCLYGYRLYPTDKSLPQRWEPGAVDVARARLLSAEFVDIGFGVPG